MCRDLERHCPVSLTDEWYDIADLPTAYWWAEFLAFWWWLGHEVTDYTQVAGGGYRPASADLDSRAPIADLTT